MASPFKPREEPAFVTSMVTCQYENVIYVKYALQSQEREQESGPPEKSEPRRMRVWHSLTTSPLPAGAILEVWRHEEPDRVIVRRNEKPSG